MFVYDSIEHDMNILKKSLGNEQWRLPTWMYLNIRIGIAATSLADSRTILRGLVVSNNHLLLIRGVLVAHLGAIGLLLRIRGVLVASWSDRPPASHSFDLILRSKQQTNTTILLINKNNKSYDTLQVCD